ncbi:hypothetical protein D1871_20575 [Nakamurella silvestris]|nr:hypothetical protein D1871_20575 [Nakamurella silvestris]
MTSSYPPRARLLTRRLPLLALVLGTALAPGIAIAELPPGTLPEDYPIAVAWGNNDLSQLGDGTAVTRTAPIQVSTGGLSASSQVSVVSSGHGSSCSIASGQTLCWGHGGSGELGNGHNSDSPVPVQVGGPLIHQFATAVSVGANHACGIVAGTAYCWGDNSHGQLGSALGPASNLPVAVDVSSLPAGAKFTQISAGTNFTCGVAGGLAYCWGLNEHGQLGIETHDDNSVPTPVHAAFLNSPVTSISAGDGHACLLGGGKAYCWGQDEHGQLGSNSKMTDSSLPLTVYTAGALTGLNIVAISAGGQNTCVLGNKAGVRKPYCWGLNSTQNLGIDSLIADSAVPVAVSLPGSLATHSVSAIATGGAGACMIVTGAGYCWGANGSGQIGDNTTTIRPVPTAVEPNGGLLHHRLQAISAEQSYTTGIAVTTSQFTDVGASYLFFDEISWLAGAGITQGYSNGSYQPTKNISRQAMAAFLFRFENPGATTPTCFPNTTRKFTDVKTNDPFCGSIEWLVDHKIVTGGGKFNPGGDTTRAVMADWVYRAQNPGLPKLNCLGSARMFTDVPATSAQCGNIEWLASVGVTNGYPTGKYLPGSPIHRDAMAAFFQRTAELAAH